MLDPAFGTAEGDCIGKGVDGRATLQRLHHGESAQRNASHVGVTNALGARAFQYRNGVDSQFTTKYSVKTLVWYEHYDDVRDVIVREKQLKKWERRWKLELIERFNPDWRDLYETLNN